MKATIVLATALLLATFSTAQNVAINQNGATAHPHAALDISSDDKGILIPRITTPARMAIVNPPDGLLVFDKDARNFWFYSGGWQEITGSGNMGSAGGDLTGQFPDPLVIKLQGHPVDALTPADGHVLKWDADDYMWKGMPDNGLSLPYDEMGSHFSGLFSITNTSNTFGTGAAIIGRRQAGSGLTIGMNAAILGDAATGAGVAGTSQSQVGVFGKSASQHGVYGQSEAADAAGVSGFSAVSQGIGVLGQASEGTGVHGKVSGTQGSAGKFENLNTASTSAVVDIAHQGTGTGIQVKLHNVLTTGTAVDATTLGTGIAVYGNSEKGISGKFENTNASNTNPTLMIANQGIGSSMYVNSLHTGVTGPTVDVLSMGSGAGLNVLSDKGSAAVLTNGSSTNNKPVLDVINTGMHNAAKFVTSNTSNFNTAMHVIQNGSGHGIESVISNSDNQSAAVHAVNQGDYGILSFGKSVASYGFATGANNGVGVWGQASANDPNGIGVKGVAGGGIAGGVGVLGMGNESNPQAIGVKGVSYTHNEDVGAVTGINMTDGVGVYGESTGQFGFGLIGAVGKTGQSATAASFRNFYNNSTRPVTEILTNGKGQSLLVENTNLTNTANMIQVRNAGTGNFIRFEDNLSNAKMTVKKNGDITTSGALTVRDNKGIVRNTGSGQLRIETIDYDYMGSGSIGVGWGWSANLEFGTGFSEPPVVWAASFSGHYGLSYLTVSITEVTTTGCQIGFINDTGEEISLGQTVMKFVALGVE